MEEIDLSEYDFELRPMPKYDSPRQFLIGEAGQDIDSLKNFFTGEDYTWDEIRAMGAMDLVMRIYQMRSHPPVVYLKKKGIEK